MTAPTASSSMTSMTSMQKWRIALATAGIALGLFGVFRLLTEIPSDDLLLLGAWLIGALVLHDGLLSPVVVTVGVVIAKVVPPRARRLLQPALIIAAGITVIALPLIYREGTQPDSKAILQQNYGGNLAIVLGVIAALTLAGYAVAVVRRRQVVSETNERAPDDQKSSTA